MRYTVGSNILGEKMDEMMLVDNFVASAVAALVINNEQLLLGRRFENNQFTGWQCPGGYLQKGETIEQAASRHCLQKAGIEIVDLSPGPYSNNLFLDQSHTTTLYVIARKYKIQNNSLYESKSIQWSWFDFDELPEPLFLPLKNLLKQYDLSVRLSKLT